MKFQHYLSPIEINGQSIRNRSVMGSMHVGLEEMAAKDSRASARFAEYFKARAQGEAGIIITGGFSPDVFGKVMIGGASLSRASHCRLHREITSAVHEYDSKICLQILHTGRYGYHPFCVAPSSIKSPISPFRPWKIPGWYMQRLIASFVRCARLAKECGYDGVEVMGSEGYLINQFLSPVTNKRTDAWGGSAENRMRLPIEIVQQIRAALGEKFLIIYRISLVDLIPGSSSFEEVVTLGRRLEECGVSIFNSGIGWHEARIPTIASMVPHAAFEKYTKAFKENVKVPVMVTNRINSPEQAEKLLADGVADFVCMARPWLADPHFSKKIRQKQESSINPCIACNQACLDHIFEQKIASCMVNPMAAFESERSIDTLKKLVSNPKKVLIVGGGLAGSFAALYLARCGHQVTLYEASDRLGGLFHLAMRIPGKEDFEKTITYVEAACQAEPNIDVLLKTPFVIRGDSTEEKRSFLRGWDEVVLATGIKPRIPSIPGLESEIVCYYEDLLSGRVAPKNRAVILGAGGIGFDVLEFLLGFSHEAESKQAVPGLRGVSDPATFFEKWGIASPAVNKPGGLEKNMPFSGPYWGQGSDAFQYTIMQRSSGKLGANLGKTTGWIHRMNLKNKNVQFYSGVKYKQIDDQGIHFFDAEGRENFQACQQIVVCAGQEEKLELAGAMDELGVTYRKIGGAKKASGIDAKKAIQDGYLICEAIIKT